MGSFAKLGLVLGAVVIAGLLVYGSVCPCGPVPGVWLSGNDVLERVDDWSFANDVPLCQLQVDAGLPRSINLNCMAADGALYVSCSNCETKGWAQHALQAPEATIRMGSRLYPVTLSRVLDADVLDVAWRARITKLQRDPATPRPDHWWSFRLRSRVAMAG